MQPFVLRVDVQSPLSGDTGSFGRDYDEGEDKTFQTTFHVYAGKGTSDLGQQILIEILQHVGKGQRHRIVLYG